MLRAVVCLFVFTLPAVADDPLKAKPPTEVSPAERAFFDTVQAVQNRIGKAKAYSVSVEAKWKTTGGKQELGGTNTVILLAEPPGKLRIEVGAAGEKEPHLCVASDGKTLTRCFHIADLYSVSKCDGTPLDDVQLDGLTLPALRAAGVDFLARPNVAVALASQVLAVETLGEGKEKGSAYRITLASGRAVTVRFDAGGLPVEVRATYDIAVGEMKKLTHTLDAKLKWDFDAKPKPDAYAITPPASAKKVDDLFAAVMAPDLEELIGKPAPAVEFAGLDGKPVKLADFKGKPVVVYAWALWAAPAVESLPGLSQFAAEYGKKGVAFVAVNVGDTPEAAKAFAEKAKFPGTVALDPLGAALGQLRAQAVPAVVVIDKDGKVAAYHRRTADTAEKVKAELDKLLK
ncbi:MAG: redoxin family protein [Fimbriiglobus sp.]|jgi:peroxiredoxin|nr:redoxin family protein [Fimbriiglobus sp.]